jgi:acetolactate decarboxylase
MRALIALVVAGLAAAAVAATSAVETFGTIRQLVGERDSAPKVTLADVLRRPHAHGLGSLSGLRGEITILDGAAWLSYPPARDGAAPRVVTSPASREKAGFLVAAHVEPKQWQKIVIAGALSSENLETIVARTAVQLALGDIDVPFRIDGKFSTLTLAIADGRKLPPGATSPDAMQKANHLATETGVDGTLVGFLAARADERFTHPGTRVHAHAIVPSRRATGHARAFAMAPGATLSLAAPPRSK